MNVSKSYLFYDLETSGLNPAFDQILQFAAIRTDENFNERERHEFRIQLRPDIIPSPGALLATDMTVADILKGDVNEYDGVRQIHELVNQPNTINVGYNSLSFDDQFLRFAFFRNLLPAYTHQWQAGCQRLDILPITMMYWLSESSVLSWPTNNGIHSLKLEELSKQNQLAIGQAHDAMVDVSATVELARRLRHDDSLWQDCLAHFDKKQVAQRRNKLPSYAGRRIAVLVSNQFGYDLRGLRPSLDLGQENSGGKRSLWLRLDTPELPQVTMSNIAEMTQVTRQKAGEPPFLLAPGSVKLELTQQTLANENLSWLAKHQEILAAIESHYRQRKFATEFNVDADAMLYQAGFLDGPLQSTISEFHRADIKGKLALIGKINDATRHTLAVRLICRNYGQTNALPSYVSYVGALRNGVNPPRDGMGQARLTAVAALSDIQERRHDQLSERQRIILRGLEEYIEQKWLQPIA